MSLDVARLRADFPILSRQVNGHPLVYLDSAASAQKPLAVIEAMRTAMSYSYANVHRGLHTLANETTSAYERTRTQLAQFLNAGSPDEIVFTKGATEAINLVANTFGQRLQAGDEIVLSVMEHHANIVPWHMLRERLGLVLHFADIKEDGTLDLDHLLGLIGARTRLVAITHMSNVLGTINPVAEIAAAAHAVGALCLVDACQSVVHLDIDVQTLGADFLVFSGHKLFGPTGIGVLWGKADILADLPPWQGGGEMIEIVEQSRITYAAPPHRFEAGTPAILEVIGLGAALDWLGTQDRAAIRAHEETLYQQTLAALAGVNGIRILGQAPGKGAILSFAVDGAHPHDLAQLLDLKGVAIRAGHHCAQPLMKRLGLQASARASFAAYNTLEEVDIFVRALQGARKMLV